MFSTIGPVNLGMQESLKVLEPEHIEVLDESHKHAGHAAMKGLDLVETHFIITIVS